MSIDWVRAKSDDEDWARGHLFAVANANVDVFGLGGTVTLSPRCLSPLGATPRSPAPQSARSCSQSLKGVSGDIIVLEEAAYCDPGLISEV